MNEISLHHRAESGLAPGFSSPDDPFGPCCTAWHAQSHNDRAANVRICRGLVDLQQCGEAFADFIKQFDRSDASPFDVSFLPGDTAHLIHQNIARNSLPMGNGNFKRITSRATCNWTHDTKTRSQVVFLRCQHDRWTMTALLVAKRGL